MCIDQDDATRSTALQPPLPMGQPGASQGRAGDPCGVQGGATPRSHIPQVLPNGNALSMLPITPSPILIPTVGPQVPSFLLTDS